MMSNEARNQQVRFQELCRAMQSTDNPDEMVYVGQLLAYAAKHYGDAPALYTNNTATSFHQLYQRARACTQWLIALGISTGDRIIMCCENTPAFYEIYYGVLQAGAVVIPVNTFLTRHELRHIISDALPRCVIASPQYVDLCTQEEVAVYATTTIPLIAVRDDEVAIRVQPSTATAVLLYTSGTTGTPKGVMLSSRAIMSNVLQGIVRFGMKKGAGERIFAVLPLFHSFAQSTCVWAPMVLGVSLILVEKIDRRLILKALKRRPTIFLGVPALFGLLLIMKGVDLSSVRCFVCGGDALPDKIQMGFMLRYGRIINVGYGLTEAAPIVAYSGDGSLGPTGYIGKPLVNVTVKLVDATGNEVPRGTLGELIITGDTIMIGYRNAPEQTARVLHDGWLYTGDLCYMLPDGGLVIAGRAKELIKHKGLNIYPAEIENVLLTHSAVLRAAVIPQKDETTGEVPVAYVQVVPGKTVSPDELRTWCEEKLAPYKVPKAFICSADPLPLTATGKVDKKKIIATHHSA